MKTALVFLLCVVCLSVQAQSKTTADLEKQYEGSTTSAFLYKNTMRMLNQKESKEFDEMIRNIEKLKFLMVRKDAVDAVDYKKVKSKYLAEDFESGLTSRYQGRAFDIFIKDGFKPGTVILVNDSTSLMVIDIVGTIDITKAGSLFTALEGSAEIGEMIRSFGDRGGKRKHGFTID